MTNDLKNKKHIFDKEHYTSEIKDFPIWKLINLSNIITNRIISIKKQGNKCDKKKLKKLMYKRNLVLKVLLQKLIIWEKSGTGNKIDISELNVENAEEVFELI
jgi:hypothetical protein